MKRLHENNINTAEWFDHVWTLEGVHRYDVVRMEAFLKDIRFDDRLLDVGAGWMGIAQYALEKDRVGCAEAIDFSPEAKRRTHESLWKLGKNSLHYYLGSALDTGFRSGIFDRVCCGELIEHIEEPADLVKELFRVCRQGGRVIIGTLDDTCEDAKRHGDYPEHLWSFTREDLVRLLSPYVYHAAYRLVGDYHFVEGVKLWKG